MDRRCVADSSDAGLDGDVGDADVDLDGSDADASLDVGVDGGQGPSIVVSPQALSFGEVGQRVTGLRSFVVGNTGTEPLVLESVTLANPTEGFSILEPLEPAEQVAPGAEVTFDVVLRPTLVPAGEPTRYANTVVVRSNDALRPTVEIPAEGTATASPAECLRITGPPSDLGYVPQGEPVEIFPLIRNCGSASITITEVELVGEADQLDLTLSGDLPRTLDPNQSFSATVTYTPTSNARFAARLVAHTDVEDIFGLFQVRGGPECPVAEIIATSEDQRARTRLAVNTGESVTITGSGSVDPHGEELLYRWKIEAPEGSEDIQVDPDLMSKSFTIMPDVGGIFTVILEAESVTTGKVSCEPGSMILDVIPVPAPILVELTWEGGADLDLHVQRSLPDGTFNSFGYIGPNEPNPDDVFYDNISPDFGETNIFWDDPRHSGDARDGGPEQVRMATLDAGRRYRVGVQYALPDGASVVNATVRVKLREEERTFTMTLERLSSTWVPTVMLKNSEGELVFEDP